MVGHALRLAWLWAALYAVGGCLSAFILVLGMGDSQLTLPGYALASFIGAALLAAFTSGESVREAVLAASVLGAAQLMFGLVGAVGNFEIVAFQTTLGPPLSTALVCIAGAAMGGHIGSRLAQPSQSLAAGLLRAVFAALLLVGAVYVHAVAIAFLSTLSHGIAVVVGLIAVALSPSCAGAVLRLTLRKNAESAMVGGIALLIVIFDIALLTLDVNPGLVALCSLVLFFAGATLYTLALPGLVAVSFGNPEDQAAAALPTAIVVQEPERPGHVRWRSRAPR